MSRGETKKPGIVGCPSLHSQKKKGSQREENAAEASWLKRIAFLAFNIILIDRSDFIQLGKSSFNITEYIFRMYKIRWIETYFDIQGRIPSIKPLNKSIWKIPCIFPWNLSGIFYMHWEKLWDLVNLLQKILYPLEGFCIGGWWEEVESYFQPLHCWLFSLCFRLCLMFFPPAYTMIPENNKAFSNERIMNQKCD